MAEFLRSEEILACVHRVALNRGQPFEYQRVAVSAEMQRRQRDAERHRVTTLETIANLHPEATTSSSPHETLTMLREGAPLILRPRVLSDTSGQRRSVVHALVRIGRTDGNFRYAPILIKNNEIIETASTRRLLEGSLEKLLPGEATFTDGYGPRSTSTVTRNGIALAHATRVLQSLGFGDDEGRAAMIDRHQRMWWFDLAGTNYPRFNLSLYDEYYEERRKVLVAHDQWREHGGTFPTSPYWHRECLECPFAPYCESSLEAIDDVSLTRFTTFDQQITLHDHGITTRALLASLDPYRAKAVRKSALNASEDFQVEDRLGRLIDKLDDLIYRARSHVRASPLRILDSESMGCPTGDVEVDIDMESYDDATYLWGASVSLNCEIEGIAPGYRAFVEWGELTPQSEADNFAHFWSWLKEIRRLCDEQGKTFRAYCFWAQAEDGAMNRAVKTSVANGPTLDDLAAFRATSPAQWIDLHDYAKQQIQTEGPLGLKQLAHASGFQWRDENPSGEASMLWYEVAINSTSAAHLSRTRLLEYNEDDCRATKALRDWLNGPAKKLPHRDEIWQ